jgi:two-component system chemotaxis sensor kinase CheA
VVLNAGEQRIAFAVDSVIDEREVLAKTLPQPLSRVRNISGATVLGTGEVVPILNVWDLMKSARHLGAAPSIPQPTEIIRPAARRVLVVEDSITSRMLLKGILESAGYSVRTAVDGIDGFTAARSERFDLIVSDVEMPRMNGFDLTARIRADRSLANVPVVLVTALESRADRERGIDVGANAYLVKSSLDQGNLLETLRRLA